MNEELLVLGGSNGEHLAIELSSIGAFELGSLEVRKFPDGETYVRVLTKVDGRTVVYINSLQRNCLLYTSPSPRDGLLSRMPSSA